MRPAASSLEATPHAPPKRDRPATILLVDDEVEMLQSLHDLLRLDYRVLSCSSGAEAIKVLESNEPVQVVMSDQRMPDILGVEVLSQARVLRPEATRLLITAYADVKAVIDAINQGRVHRYLTKPWESDELLAVVRQAVERSDLVNERNRLLVELQESNQRLVEAGRVRTAFIEVASHELNTPVAVVLGLAQLWRLTHAEKATESEQLWMERIQNAGKRLAGTVDRMLKLVKSEDFGSPLDLRPTPIAPLIEEAIQGVLPFAQRRGQTLRVDVEKQLGEAEIDLAKIGDAMTNLLINAIKFSPDGGEIRVSAKSVGTDLIQFEVSDQGVGIAPELQPFLFEPFFTGFDTKHHSSGEFEFGKRGIGLGLCLVKRFAELHGGTVSVKSEPGTGSTFAFQIPRHQSALIDERTMTD